jgi:hypothetical protein
VAQHGQLKLLPQPPTRLPTHHPPPRSGGVIDKCCDELNHGVLLVGYGKDEKTGEKYYLVKNSWGGCAGVGTSGREVGVEKRAGTASGKLR